MVPPPEDVEDSPDTDTDSAELTTVVDEGEDGDDGILDFDMTTHEDAAPEPKDIDAANSASGDDEDESIEEVEVDAVYEEESVAKTTTVDTNGIIGIHQKQNPGIL